MSCPAGAPQLVPPRDLAVDQVLRVDEGGGADEDGLRRGWTPRGERCSAPGAGPVTAHSWKSRGE
eukprot:3886402-Pyramimonas_sp.AAC.1